MLPSACSDRRASIAPRSDAIARFDEVFSCRVCVSRRASRSIELDREKSVTLFDAVNFLDSDAHRMHSQALASDGVANALVS